MVNMSILRRFFLVVMDEVGGADRDRTDDLKLAKLALSQLSYGPSFATATFAAAQPICAAAHPVWRKIRAKISRGTFASAAEQKWWA